MGDAVELTPAEAAAIRNARASVIAAKATLYDAEKQLREAEANLDAFTMAYGFAHEMGGGNIGLSADGLKIERR